MPKIKAPRRMSVTRTAATMPPTLSSTMGHKGEVRRLNTPSRHGQHHQSQKDQARRRRQRGTRAHLKGRRPSPPTEWGVPNQLGREASSLCFYYGPLCTTRKAAHSPRHAWLLRSVLGGLCASQMAAPSSPDRRGLLNYQCIQHPDTSPQATPWVS